ncbi:MAG: hypothetical protein ABWZ40_14280 [Caulobacterales bacterium]
MAQQITLNIDAKAAERLERLASETGETVEALAQRVLEDAAEDIGGDLGDDAELGRRIALWRETRAAVDGAQVHDWLDSLPTNAPLSRPLASRRG